MRLLALVPGIVIIVVVLLDVFEVIVLPRRVERTARPARYFYRGMWSIWRWATGWVRGPARESLLSLFGPLSLLMLLVTWAALLVIAYSLLYWAAGHTTPGNTTASYAEDLYYSGTTFFTLGLGDVTPTNWAAKLISVLQAANGFGFLALVIGYLPIFNQSFSRREAQISLLDARAGSPPTAGELLRRLGEDQIELRRTLRQYEQWASELLESHLSYPVLMFFRSQHERESWVATLTAILDASAIVMVRGSRTNATAAQLTFAMARHAAVDLSDVFERAPSAPELDRLEGDEQRLEELLAGIAHLSEPDPGGIELAGLRITYEPYVDALSRYLLMPLPSWVAREGAVDAWQTSRVEESALGLADPIGDRQVQAGRNAQR